MVDDALGGGEAGAVALGARYYYQDPVVSSEDGLVVLGFPDDAAVAGQAGAAVVAPVVQVHLAWLEGEYLEPGLLVRGGDGRGAGRGDVGRLGRGMRYGFGAGEPVVYYVRVCRTQDGGFQEEPVALASGLVVVGGHVCCR